MQFLILLIGVMVFIFYQFQPPPLVFNDVEAAKIERGARAGEYRALSAEYEGALAGRGRAATAYAGTREGDGAPELMKESRAAYLAADNAVKDVRARGIALVKDANGNKNFNDVNYVFPTFIVRNMPMGVVGLIIAAIFAAAMSSISAELNALATASTIDFYRRHFRPDATDSEYVRFGRMATAVWGLFACIVALYATSLGSLIEVVNKFGSFFYGSLLGVFVLAVAVPRARSRGAFWGLILGVASVWLASFYTNIAFLWFNLIGCVVVVAVGYLLSLTVKESSAMNAG
jgi:Na+(H+)/acetate symporter ActP